MVVKMSGNEPAAARPSEGAQQVIEYFDLTGRGWLADELREGKHLAPIIKWRCSECGTCETLGEGNPPTVYRFEHKHVWVEVERLSTRPTSTEPSEGALDPKANQVHALKTWPTFFNAVVEGRKRHEVRRNDRDFRVGDCLVLQEFDPQTQQYSGEMCSMRVTYLSDAFMPAGFVVMSIEPWAEIERLRAVQQDKQPDWANLSRLEVISENGRQYTRWRCAIEPSFQDQGRTLKLFVKER